MHSTKSVSTRPARTKSMLWALLLGAVACAEMPAGQDPENYWRLLSLQIPQGSFVPGSGMVGGDSEQHLATPRLRRPPLPRDHLGQFSAEQPPAAQAFRDSLPRPHHLRVDSRGCHHETRVPRGALSPGSLWRLEDATESALWRWRPVQPASGLNSRQHVTHIVVRSRWLRRVRWL